MNLHRRTRHATGSHVDWKASTSLVGTVLKWLSVPLSFPLVLALYYREPVLPFVATIAVTASIGYGLERLDADPDIGLREAFLMVATAWFATALVGALPYLIAGDGAIAYPVNALFESMSGFTTTGATVLEDISFETHARSILMWRQMTQWLGGMGIIVLMVAILSGLGVGGLQLMETEAPGPRVEKLTPHIADTARTLWVLYFAITLIEMGILYGLHLTGFAPNMTLYNAVAHGFTTMPTGGFSPEARSIEAFSATVQWVIISFMVVAGTNFALIWHVKEEGLGRFLEDEEFRLYVGVLGGIGAVSTVLLLTGAGLTGSADGIAGTEEGIRHALFQTVSLTTTTGFANTDFDLWTPPLQFLLFTAMFIGGSAGSTAGCVKILRWLVAIETVKREFFTIIHPEAVRPIRIGDDVIDERAIFGIVTFVLLYFLLFFLASIFILEDGARVGLELSSFEAMSASAATIGNIGPGFGIIGPMGNYHQFPDSTKLLMVFLMWIGRLEILSVLVIFTPTFWRR